MPHHLLSTYYRAADVCLVPSRSESFGLVALEAAACGTPVVAAAVGGLRTLVDHGRTGFLVEGGDPAYFAAYVDELLGAPALAAEPWAGRPPPGPATYTWSTTAARLRRLYADLATRAPVVLLSATDPGRPSRVGRGARRPRGPDRRLVRAGRPAENPMVAAVDRGEPGERRWYVRVRGEQKDTFTIWFTLGQRTLHYETYVMPAPEENHAAFYEHLLVRNLGLRGWSFAIGEEAAVFLTVRWAWRPWPTTRRLARRARPGPGLRVGLRRAVLPPRAADRLCQ